MQCAVWKGARRVEKREVRGNESAAGSKRERTQKEKRKKRDGERKIGEKEGT